MFLLRVKRNKRVAIVVFLLLLMLVCATYLQYVLSVKMASHSGDIEPLALQTKVVNYVRQLETLSDSSKSSFADNTKADILKKKVRVLCLILTTEQRFYTQARVVNATWARRCNKHYFLISSRMPSTITKNLFPNSIVTNLSESRENLIFKVQNAFQFAYANLIDEFDWIIKADDDTYVIVENLRYLLSYYNSSDAGYLGFHFNNYIRDYGFMSGGAGYVISNRALRRLVEYGLNVPGACALTKTYLIPEVSEDFEIGKCLKKTGVPVLKSLDKIKRETFHPYTMMKYLMEQLPEYLVEWSNNKQTSGMFCCSEYSISFHYTSPVDMLLMDHLLYRTSVYGRNEAGNKNTNGNDVFDIGYVTNMSKPAMEINENSL